MLREFAVGEPPVPVIEIARKHGLTVKFSRFPTKRSKVSGFILDLLASGVDAEALDDLAGLARGWAA